MVAPITTSERPENTVGLVVGALADDLELAICYWGEGEPQPARPVERQSNDSGTIEAKNSPLLAPRLKRGLTASPIRLLASSGRGSVTNGLGRAREFCVFVEAGLSNG